MIEMHLMRQLMAVLLSANDHYEDKLKASREEVKEAPKQEPTQEIIFKNASGIANCFCCYFKTGTPVYLDWSNFQISTKLESKEGRNPFLLASSLEMLKNVDISENASDTRALDMIYQAKDRF